EAATVTPGSPILCRTCSSMLLHLSKWAHALEPVRLPLLKLRANHSPNPALRKSLIFSGTSAWKSKKSEKSKMSNRLTFEFAGKARKSTIRELQASRRELLVQLAHKTYEPAREKAEERGQTMIHSAEKRSMRASATVLACLGRA